METATLAKFMTCPICDMVYSRDQWTESPCGKGSCPEFTPAPQETPAQHSPLPWRKEGRAAMLDGGSTIKHPCFNGKIIAANKQQIVSTSTLLGVTGKTPEEAEANAELIVKCVNRDPAFQKLVEVTRMVEAWLSSRKDLTERLRASGDTLANTSSHEMDILDKAREALRLAREGEI